MIASRRLGADSVNAAEGQPASTHSRLTRVALGVLVPQGAVKGAKGASKLSAHYPADSGPPTVHQKLNALPEGRALHSAAILRLAFSGDGSRLATASVDRTARVVRRPPSLSYW